MTAQLPLAFPLRDRFAWDRFVVGANGELARLLKRPVAGFACVWAWGAPGVGKSHLLQALCREQGGAYVPAPALRQLDGYEAFERVLIDDVDVWFGDRPAEEALFRLYNQQLAQGHQLALAGRCPPAAARFALPDLASRLRGGACFEMLPLDEAAVAEALQRAAADRGIRLGEDALRFLQRHASRDLASLLTLLERVDREALAAGRPVTVPLLKRALQARLRECAPS